MNYYTALTPSSRRLVLDYARRTGDIPMAAALAVVRSDRSSRALAPVGVIGGASYRAYQDYYHRDELDSVDELVRAKLRIRAEVRREHGATIRAIRKELQNEGF